MKKSLALLLASAFLVFALTACGGDKKEDGVNGSDTPTTEDSMDDPDSSVTDDILDGTGTTNGDRDTADDGLLDSGDQTPADNGTTAPVPGDDTATDNHTSNQDGTTSGTDSDTGSNRARIGSSYGQMLENARVHDSDGDLTDYENAVTPGAASTR